MMRKNIVVLCVFVFVFSVFEMVDAQVISGEINEYLDTFQLGEVVITSQDKNDEIKSKKSMI
ncbi:MAG: hypothetical protein R2771_11825 [Saprospiraceae bacterium]